MVHGGFFFHGQCLYVPATRVEAQDVPNIVLITSRFTTNRDVDII